MQEGTEKQEKFSLVLNTNRLESEEERWLPPGCMRDYYEQFRQTHDCSDHPASFTTFWRVWRQDFGFLRFRPYSSHSLCNTCMRYKLMLKELSQHLRARQLQHVHLANHLKAQYNDRIKYWELRGASRLRGPFEVTIVIDGMDQAKFCYPRSTYFQTKELQSLNRPRAHITGLIAHGQFVMFFTSPSDTLKDASAHVDMIAHSLQVLSESMDLGKLTVNIQSDNTPREVKNNIVLRFLSMLVAHRTFHLLRPFLIWERSRQVCWE